jgi:hypothetical protein
LPGSSIKRKRRGKWYKDNVEEKDGLHGGEEKEKNDQTEIKSIFN